MGLEGELRVGLRVSRGRIASVRITSTRPDVARSLLQGRTRAEVAAAVPLLFSICGRSQAAVSELACAAAAGEASRADALAHCRASVAAETVREIAWRTLLDWPKELGEQPTDQAIAAARGSLAIRVGAPAGQGGDAIAAAAFGVAAADWLAMRSLAELDHWLDAGQTAAARFIRKLRDDDSADVSARGRMATSAPLLASLDHAAWIAELSAACEADPGFSSHPTWRGEPAETGALARLQSDGLIVELVRRSASRVPARFVARLRELAWLLTGRATATVGAQDMPRGGAIAWVENARGLLIHQVRLDGNHIVDYRIVAPTEWNFHPRGALALALANTPVSDTEDARRRSLRLVHSLDPCVACRVEVDDA